MDRIYIYHSMPVVVLESASQSGTCRGCRAKGHWFATLSQNRNHISFNKHMQLQTECMHNDNITVQNKAQNNADDNRWMIARMRGPTSQPTSHTITATILQSNNRICSRKWNGIQIEFSYAQICCCWHACGWLTCTGDLSSPHHR